MNAQMLRKWLAAKLRASDLTIGEIADMVDLTPATIYSIMGERKRDIKLETFIKLHKVVTGQYPIIVEVENVRHLRKVKP